jgi:hypothetical protein
VGKEVELVLLANGFVIVKIKDEYRLPKLQPGHGDVELRPKASEDVKQTMETLRPLVRKG